MEDDTKKLIEELKEELRRVKETLASHTHSGNDGSTYIYQDSVGQKTQQYYKVGAFGMSEVSGTIGGGFVNRGVFVLGNDEIGQDGFDNAQITLEHQPESNGTTNQTFWYGYRGKLYAGLKGKVIEGESVLYETEFEFEPGSLIGHHINFIFSAGIIESYEIISNTKNTVTIDGVWGRTNKEGVFIIFVPVYFGSADFPWRRLYTTDGIGGGIRFGFGSTGQGQNGLLFNSGENLYWRSPNGTISGIA